MLDATLCYAVLSTFPYLNLISYRFNFLGTVLGAVLDAMLDATLCYAVLYLTVVYHVYCLCYDVLSCGRVRYMMYYSRICPMRGLGGIN